MGFLIREGILKLPLPYSIRRKGISLIPLPFGIKINELLGNILDGGTDLILCLGPAGAANLVDPYASRNIVRDLPDAMKKYGIDSF